MSYRIIGDSCVDTNEKMEKELELIKVPFSVNIGEKVIVDEDIDLPMFLEEMNNSPEPTKTAAPSPGGFLSALEGAKEAFIVTISSKLSASYSNAVLAMEMAKEKCKDLQGVVIDSKSAMAGESLAALKIKEFMDLGLSVKEAGERVQQFINNEMQTFFVLETFDNLIKNGRMSLLKGKLAALLHISPIMYGDDGEIRLLETVRGNKKALRRMVEAIEERVENIEERILVIAHCNHEERANDVYQMVKERYRFKRIEIAPTTALGGVYSNQGGIVLAF